MKTLIVHIEYDEKEVDLTYIHNVVERALHDAFEYGVGNDLTGVVDIGWRYFNSLYDTLEWEETSEYPDA